jgi:hypothetical protein
MEVKKKRKEKKRKEKNNNKIKWLQEEEVLDRCRDHDQMSLLKGKVGAYQECI